MPYHQLMKVDKRSKKKSYFEVGEDFSYGLVRLRCEEHKLCQGCFFENRGEVSCFAASKSVGNCSGGCRPDKKTVIFKKVEE